MTKPKMLSANIPFDGFYHSLYSDLIESEEKQHCDYEATQRQSEKGIPPELHLSSDTLEQILFDVTDYRKAYAGVAHAYCDAFCNEASDAIGIPLRLKFEAMTSPREYNFETDRVFADIPLAVVHKLFAASKADNHAALKRTIKERFTSYDGFISGYSNDLSDWITKPRAEWDHNEIGTLILALFSDADPEWRMTVYYAVADCDGCYHEWEAAVDWLAYDRKVSEARDAIIAEKRALDPDYVPPPVRCDQTPDLFA